MKLAVQVYPADDSEIVTAARELVRALADTESMESTADVSNQPPRGDWVSIAGLVLAAPGAATALLDLAARLAKGRGRAEARQRIEPPLTRAQAAAQAGGRQATLTVGEVTLDLGRASIDQVLDALATAGIRAQGGKP